MKSGNSFAMLIRYCGCIFRGKLHTLDQQDENDYLLDFEGSEFCSNQFWDRNGDEGS